MGDLARAAVLTSAASGDRRFEVREIPLPSPGRNEAILRVEACGICGSDVEQLHGRMGGRRDLIPGHETVGTLEQIGSDAAARWGLREGDRVAVESTVPCRSCAACLGGRYTSCRGWNGFTRNYGFVPLHERSGLWGGYATHHVLDGQAVLHRLDPAMAAERAVLFNALGAGFRWAVNEPGLSVGDSLVVLGCGQRGLAAVMAARTVGAGLIVVTGLGSVDAHKLDMARRLGADIVVDVERESVIDVVMAATNGLGADVVVDVTPGATGSITDAVKLARVEGTIVLAGLKGDCAVPAFMSDDVVLNQLRIIGVRAVDHRSFRQALRLLETDRFPFDELISHRYGLDDAELAVRTQGNERGGAPLHVLMVPEL